MKNIAIIATTLLLFLCSLSCKKEKTLYETRQSNSVGSITALLNGKQWTSDVVYSGKLQNSRFGFTAYILNSEGWYRQALGFASVNPMANEPVYSWINDDGTNKSSTFLSNNCIASFGLMEEDAGENNYNVVSSGYDNHYVITNYDPASGFVEGTFQVKFYRSHIEMPRTQGLPDTLYFTDGHFRVQIQQ